MNIQLKESNKYDDIIHLPHHVSSTRPHMSLYDRAAQFSPFAALTGHDQAMKETARLTDHRILLDESSQQLLDERLQTIRNVLNEHPMIRITYFVPDPEKPGGSYNTVTGRVWKMKDIGQVLQMEDGQQIEMKDIIEIDGDLFNRML